MNKVLSTIGLCRRGGKLVMGFDAAVEELASPKSKAAGVILASGVSQKTEKEIRFNAEKYGREVIVANFTMEEAQATVGKKVGVFVILDRGLYSSIKSSINNETT